MAEYSGEKHLEPTPHRRQQARGQGHVARSHDLVSAVLLLLGLLVLMVAGGGLIEFLGRYMTRQLGGEAWLSTDVASVHFHFQETLRELSRHLLPIFGLLLLGAVVANLAQVGFLFLPEKVMPDVARINPLAGLRRLFSLSGTARLGFGLLKILVIGGVAWIDLYARRDSILGLGGASPVQIGSFLLGVLLWTSLKIGLALLVLAVLDYALQRWKHEQDLKMTTQELREEMRNVEGDPQLRARRRRVGQQLAEGRVGQAVPKADVVLTGPGSLAVAIRYDPATMAAPTVVAKGAGTAAGRIRQLALINGTAQVENGPLAWAVHREVDVGRPIPPGWYASVAELLAAVYQSQGQDILDGVA